MDKYKILLVEDDDAFRKLYVGVLENADFEVTEAEDGEKGLKLAKDKDFDVIILDVMLPKLDGLAVLTELKKIPEKKSDYKAIFLTNLAQESMVTQAKQLGVPRVLVKSDVTPDQVVEIINSLLKK